MSDAPRLADPKAPTLVSDAHALMALGAISSAVGARRSRLASGSVALHDDARFPEAPEWLELWYEAVKATREDALADLREERGVVEPTDDERLEVETMAQAHYEAYARLAKTSGLANVDQFIAWEAMPESRRGLMKAVIADMLTAGFISVGPTAAREKGSRELWVVFTAKPGPGAATLVGELEVGGKFIETEKVLEVLKGASEFVEVEDAAGVSHGPDYGLRWEEHPSSDELVRLGPFRVP